jgi:Fur family transcriptional regulator, stress-responsive regulator
MAGAAAACGPGEYLDNRSSVAVVTSNDSCFGGNVEVMTHPAGGHELYAEQAWDSHYPVVCRSCGAVADVACVLGHAPCLQPASRAGYTIDGAEVTFRGLCAACRDA